MNIESGISQSASGSRQLTKRTAAINARDRIQQSRYEAEKIDQEAGFFFEDSYEESSDDGLVRKRLTGSLSPTTSSEEILSVIKKNKSTKTTSTNGANLSHAQATYSDDILHQSEDNVINARNIRNQNRNAWLKQLNKWRDAENEGIIMANEKISTELKPLFLYPLIDNMVGKVVRGELSDRLLENYCLRCGEGIRVVVRQVIEDKMEMVKTMCPRAVIRFILDSKTKTFNSSDPRRFYSVSAYEETQRWQAKWRDRFLPFPQTKSQILLNLDENDDIQFPKSSFRYKSCGFVSNSGRRLMASLREVVVDRNWQAVGFLLARIEVHSMDDKVRKEMAKFDVKRVTSRYFINRYSLVSYVPQIWRCGLQRFLEHDVAPRIKLQSATDWMARLLKMEPAMFQKWHRKSAHGLMFVDLVVYALGIDELSLADQILNNANAYVGRHIDREYALILKSYSGLAAYLKWQERETASVENNASVDEQVYCGTISLSRTECDLLQVQEEKRDLAVNTLHQLNNARQLELAEGQGFSCLIASVAILTSLASTEEAVHLCETFVQNFPQLTGSVAQLLDTHKLHQDAHRVRSMAMNGSVVSASDDLWLDWAAQRLRFLGPESAAVLSECFRVLAEWLDYGENAHSETAWTLFALCLEMITATDQCTSIVSVVWEDRKDWWPSFHQSYVCSPNVEQMKNGLLGQLSRLCHCDSLTDML